MKIRVADYIIDYIYKKGTNCIFTIAGGGAMFLNDAVVCHKKIKYICNHHEQAAAMAAEAYAKISHKPGAVMTTSGPASTNAITGVLEAWQNSVPVIFISSQAKKSQMISFSNTPFLRQLGIQEVNIIPLVKSITKYAVVVDKPENIRFHLENAYLSATSGRPGPVWLDIPSDVASSTIDPKKLLSIKTTNDISKKLYPTDKEINQVINLIKHSSRPLIIAGGGIRTALAVKLLNQLVKFLKIPVVVTDMGLDIFEFNSPYYIGHAGTKGQRAANMVIQNSDLILSLGSRLAVAFTGHEYGKFAPLAKKIVIDIDKMEHQKKAVKIDQVINCDLKYFLKKLIKEKKLIKINKNAWLKKTQELKKNYFSFIPKTEKNKNSVSMYLALQKISYYAKKESILITDAGITAYVFAQTLKLKKNQRVIIPGSSLTMGYNLPAVVGVWAAQKKSKIICVTGDGSFQTNIHELQTIIHHKIPVKIFITNNHGYLAIRITQKNYFEKRLMGESPKSGISFPDTEKVANAFGFKFIRVSNYRQLDQVIPRVINSPGAVICEIICPPWEEVLTVSSKKLPDGKIVSLPIDEMSPFLPEKELLKIRRLSLIK